MAGLSAADRAAQLLLAAATLLVASRAASQEISVPPERPVARMSIEELANVEVTTVSKRAEPQLAAAAAVYVITRDEILRSGATSIPEALRLAPGVEVARINSHSWAISIRGFNSTTANKLLVLIDGRSVYTPLYSGVFWDAQDVLLEDVERIEVVAGPGGTLWGANAVNGVINVITRRAGDTLGTFVEAGGGEAAGGFGAVRHGAPLGEGAFARAYLKHFDRGAGELPDGSSAFDSWRQTQGGFRYDWEGAAAALTVQGDAYQGDERDLLTTGDLGSPVPATLRRGSTTLRGANLLARVERQVEGGAQLHLQAYYDRTDRRIAGSIREVRSTYDLDLQLHSRFGDRHDVVSGLGYRTSRDALDNTAFIAFEPSRRTDQLFSLFAQDRIDLWRERLALTLGAKLEHNDYTGFEAQPNLRLALRVDPRKNLWLAVSRAVRTPSRLDADLVLTTRIAVPSVPLPVLVVIRGDPDFAAETLLAYEAGYRVQVLENVAIDLAAFYDDYGTLRSTEAETPQVILDPADPHIVLPNRLGNGLEGSTRGGTLAVRWSVVPSWVVQGSYSHLEIRLHAAPGSNDVSTARGVEGSSPENQWALRSSLDLPAGFQAHADLRSVGALPAGGVASYLGLDAGLGWRGPRGLELSLTGQNLLAPRHREFGEGQVEVERGVFGKATWRF